MSLYKNTRVWGNPAWIFLHCISFTYPEHPTKKDKKEYKAFLNSLQFVLPCSLCRKHIKEYFKKHPIDKALEGRNQFVCYLIHLRNYINVHYKNETKLPLKAAKLDIQEQCRKNLG